MPQNYREQHFEEHIEQHLLQSGYRKGLAAEYDKDLCLMPAEVIRFLQSTQPNEYAKLEQQYGVNTPQKLCARIAHEISQKGTLEVLRKGIKDRGAKFRLAYYQPQSGLNPEHERLYRLNRFTVVRQLRYSRKNENSLDLVLFLNGLPIITAELKNSLTGQFVEEAIKQYQTDRDPAEPLLKFKRCLVHFAVGSEKVFMTTHLQKGNTHFLPFNKDTENPVNPHGHQTAYLWEDLWQPPVLLTLLDRYLCFEIRTEKIYNERQKQVVTTSEERLLFPRFHQLDVVRKILAAVRAEGVGQQYLVQHSAGSGKSNSIAWLAHQLAGFYQHDADAERLFDSVIVVTDRRVLDKQLQRTISQFEQTAGVVNCIDKHSDQLRQALEGGKDIIISTLQKFPVIAAKLAELRVKGKRFAVIIDEAHSSQSGESSKQLKQVLSVNLEEAEAADQEDFDLEDLINQEQEARGRQPHISYFAFTATPKGKTLELFGRRNAEGQFVAFHIYSMRQAIEERFILDVLKNYTTFERYFKLVKTIEGDSEHEKKQTIRLLKSYVDLQPHAIEMKARIMLDHFLAHTVKTIGHRGRAMVVTRSRLHAVRFFQTFQRIMAEKHLKFKPLVAFSGEVKDPDTQEKHTEHSLNKLPPKLSIEDAFKTPEYRLLIAANKFQVGFDEPLLHTMYVDKRLAGVQAVQTLSRLNRFKKGKEDPLVLDFENDAEDIQQAFQDYYQTTMLDEETDQNKLYDLQGQLAAFHLFAEETLNAFAMVFFDKKQPQEHLQPILDQVVADWRERPEQEREDFRSILQKYIRAYGFLSQILTFRDADLEKLYVFARHLNRKLDRRRDRLPYEVLDAVDLDSFRIQETFSAALYLTKQNAEIPTAGDGGVPHPSHETDFLSHILELLNDTYGINLSDEDKVDLERIKIKLESNDDLRTVFTGNNTLEAIRYKFNQALDALILEFVFHKLELYKKLTEPDTNAMFKRKWFEELYRKYQNPTERTSE
ncbi:putative type I restriction enzyme R protein [Candidatus Vecturithrix granuli]|uniref:Putative type I restriction enzyme R protein n=1 Tax=Vecturithrix granuli TaxID=1499967 RepID=A0A081C8A9_VECG1|nr:putative type I restriction enzyme R protein [Candidatus Vecturithrix granuli]